MVTLHIPTVWPKRVRMGAAYYPWSGSHGQLFRPCWAYLPSYAMLMRLNKAETDVHGCHSTGNRLRACVQVLARPWGCVV